MPANGDQRVAKAADEVGGAGTLLLAVTVASWGILELKRLKTTIQPGKIPARLVTTGPFRFTRNPLYVALLLVLTALALLGNSLWLAFGTGALWLLLDRLVVVREELQIRQSFGSEYLAYAARVRRWLCAQINGSPQAVLFAKIQFPIGKHPETGDGGWNVL